MIIETVKLKKTYVVADNEINAVNDVNIQLERGTFTAIMGTSGSGKSTFLHLIGGLDLPSSGKVLVDGVDISQMSDKELSRFRNEKVGFVFQKFNLINEMTIEENVVLPILISGKKVDRDYIDSIIEYLGLKDRVKHTPLQLSGGQQQRVAIARALANKPDIILCDEPTGNLDKKNSNEVVELLDKIHMEFQKTIIMVTHDVDVASKAKIILKMDDGKFI